MRLFFYSFLFNVLDTIIILFHLKFRFLYCNKYYEVLFDLIGFEEYFENLQNVTSYI